jgi:hypothetical protein
MKNTEIIQFLKENVEPLKNDIFGDGYRVAVHLTDGTFLPCVIFRNPRTITELVIKRFRNEHNGVGLFGRKIKDYYENVKYFATYGNRIKEYYIDSISLSKYAFPISVLQQIGSETAMGWTGFKVRMKDGSIFKFGTTANTEFFHMPDGYAVEDIDKIENGDDRSILYSKVSDETIIYRECIFFECYIENL